MFPEKKKKMCPCMIIFYVGRNACLPLVAFLTVADFWLVYL